MEHSSSLYRKVLLILAGIVAAALVIALGAYIYTQRGASNMSEAQLQQKADALIKAGNPAACASIPDATYRAVCTNNIALSKAKVTGDISYCKQMDGKLVTEQYCEQMALVTYSLKTNDVNVCDKATTTAVKAACTKNFYEAQAVQKQDPNACQQSSSPKTCLDTYYLQKMFADPLSVTCSDFSTTTEVADCTHVQRLFAHASTSPITRTSFLATCQKVTTPLFQRFCSTEMQRVMTTSAP